MLANGDAGALHELAGALAKEGETGYSRILQAAVHRALAAAYLQAGNATAALAEQGLVAANLRTLDQRLDALAGQAKLDLKLRNEREAAWALLSGGDPMTAPPRAPTGTNPAEFWPGQALQSFLRRDLGWAFDDKGPGAHVPELRATALRHLGHVAAALAAAKPRSRSLGFHTTESIETARSWLALHQPRRALALLEENLRQYPPSGSFLPQFRQLQEVRAQCLALLGQSEQALAAADHALRVTASTDATTQRRLAERRGDLLLRLGRPAAALDAYVGGTQADIGANLAALPLPTRLRTARTAAAAGKTEVAEQARRSAGAETSRAPLADRVEVFLHESHTLLVAGRTEESVQIAKALEKSLLAGGDPWLLARARVRLAEVNAAAGGSRAAVSELDQAARALQQWLLGYARFRGDPIDDARIDTLRELGQTAIRLLADLAATLQPEDLPSAWRIVEAFRSPVELALGTRPAKLRAPGLDAATYERARADWLAARLRADQGTALPLPDDVELAQLEASMSARWPTYFGAVLPRVPPLAEARRAVAEGTALVVLAASRERGVAFVLTRTDAALVPFVSGPVSPGRPTAASLQAAAEQVLAPILASHPFRSASCRRLLIAPVGVLRVLPLEWSLVPKRGAGSGAEREPLLLQFEVACVPSGSAWFDQRLAKVTGSRGAPSTEVLIVINDQQETGVQKWLTEVLSPMRRGQPPRFLLADRPWLATTRAVGLSLLIDPGAGDCSFAALRRSAEAVAESLTQQDVRDSATAAELAIVHAATPPVDAVAEAEALAGFAHALGSAGVDDVVTVGGAASSDPRRDLVLAIASARSRQADVVTAMTDAAREILRRGGLPTDCAGIRLWSVGR
jgi:tetratricopeptide (TPR) repeat protein